MEDENINSYGCEHYLRNCKLISPCCENVYACRLCHNDEKYDMCTDPKLKHKLNRFDVKEVICNECDTQQPISNQCQKCDIVFGKYFCNICNLFDDTDKEQYHCVKCGFCRVGGSEDSPRRPDASENSRTQPRPLAQRIAGVGV